jgi:hypothetical protein
MGGADSKLIHDAFGDKKEVSIRFGPNHNPDDNTPAYTTTTTTTSTTTTTTTSTTTTTPASAYTDAEGHWDANTVVHDGSTIESWTDLSGKGFDVTGDAVYVANAINGHPAIHFEDNQYLVSDESTKHGTNCDADNSFTWVSVVKMESGGTDWRNIFSPMERCTAGYDGTYDRYPWSMSARGVHGWSTNPDWQIDGICQANEMCVYVHRYDADTDEYSVKALQQDGESKAFTKSMLPSCNSGAQGCVAFGRGMQNDWQYFEGYIGEFVAFDTALPDDELSTMMADLKDKWTTAA